MPYFPVRQPLLKLGIFLLLISIMVSCSFFGDRKKGQYIPITFDLKTEIGSFGGLGANVPLSFYSRRMKVLQTFNELGIKYIRVKREAENWDNILAIRSATSRLGVKWIYSLDDIPPSFLNDYGQLVDIQGFATWWAEEVDELLYQDVPADYIELLDRPDVARKDSIPFTADVYNDLIHATRAELDLRDFKEVELIGPGLSRPDLSGDRETWFMYLDQDAFSTLSYWTVQMWEDKADQASFGVPLSRLMDYLKRTESEKPIFVTAYASSKSSFNGVQYPDPDEYDALGNQDTYETYYYSATFTMPYALQVYSNTLDLLKQKSVVPFLYQIYDAPADVKYNKKSWGLLDLNGGAKPVFTLLANLMKRVPRNASIIAAQPMNDDQLDGLVFSDRSTVVVTMLNESDMPKSVQINLEGAGHPLELATAISCYTTALFTPDLGKRDNVIIEDLELKLRYDGKRDANIFSVTLKPQSTFVCEVKVK